MSRRLKKTHELLAKLFSHAPSLKEILASPFRVQPKLIESWARPKATLTEFANTGKGNPLDRVEMLLEMAHPYDPEMAREIAEHFPRFVDELDRRAGLYEAEEEEHPCKAVARVLENYSKFIVAGLGNCDDPQKLNEMLDKTQLMKSSVIQLESCLKGILKKDDPEFGIAQSAS